MAAGAKGRTTDSTISSPRSTWWPWGAQPTTSSRISRSCHTAIDPCMCSRQDLGPREGFEFYARTPAEAVTSWQERGFRCVARRRNPHQPVPRCWACGRVDADHRSGPSRLGQALFHRITHGRKSAARRQPGVPEWDGESPWPDTAPMILKPSSRIPTPGTGGFEDERAASAVGSPSPGVLDHADVAVHRDSGDKVVVHEPGRRRPAAAWPLSQVPWASCLLAQLAGAPDGTRRRHFGPALTRYRSGPGYLDNRPRGRRYYDDNNAWLGLAAAQEALHRWRRPVVGPGDRARCTSPGHNTPTVASTGSRVARP